MTAVDDRGPRLRRVRLHGAELRGLDPALPAASVRLLLPRPDGALELPSWNGNEFLLDDGSRPAIRTVTPIRIDPEVGEVTVEVVRHGEGALSEWVGRTGPGDEVAVSGTGRGFEIDADVDDYVLAGDESAIPAITTLLESLPTHAQVRVVVEITSAGASTDLPSHPNCSLEWVELPDGEAPGAALLAAVRSLELDDGTVVWAAGEAAGVQRIRKHLFDERQVPRSRAHVRGYWKQGRIGAGSA